MAREWADAAVPRGVGLQAYKRLVLFNHLAFLDQEFGDNAAFQMLHQLDIVDRHHLAGRDGQFADLGDRRPDNDEPDEAAAPVEQVGIELGRTTVLERKRQRQVSAFCPRRPLLLSAEQTHDWYSQLNKYNLS